MTLFPSQILVSNEYYIRSKINMRIAYDYQAFFMQKYGGISRYYINLASKLHALGQQVKIFAPLHQNCYSTALPTHVFEGYKINNFPPKSNAAIILYNEISTRLNINKWNPDILHHTYYSQCKLTPKKIPVVLTVYDMIHELFSDQFSPVDRTSIFKRMAVQRANKIICISESTKRDLIRLFGVSSEKISVVHLGFDFFNSLTIDNDRPIVHHGKPYLLYVGSRFQYKNFERFIGSIASSKRLMQDFNIILFGGGLLTQLELEYLNKLGFSEGQVSQVDGGDSILANYYRGAEAFVYPSLYEGFGIPPLEAMACMCPVIASNSSSMPEVIGDAGEFFNPYDQDDMTNAIERVVYSDERKESLKKSGIKRLSYFSWDKCARETLEIYNQM